MRVDDLTRAGDKEHRKSISLLPCLALFSIAVYIFSAPPPKCSDTLFMPCRSVLSEARLPSLRRQRTWQMTDSQVQPVWAVVSLVFVVQSACFLCFASTAPKPAECRFRPATQESANNPEGGLAILAHTKSPLKSAHRAAATG